MSLATEATQPQRTSPRSAMEDKLACTELIYRLARGLDRRDPEILRSVFHDDATDDHGTFVGSAKDFVPWVMGVLGTMIRTNHCISNTLVEVDGDAARSESYFQAFHHIQREGHVELLTAVGRYLDTFERRDGVWKIKHRCAVYDWNHVEPAADTWDRNQPGRRFGQRGPADPSYDPPTGLP
jgi:hypothetical protein